MPGRRISDTVNGRSILIFENKVVSHIPKTKSGGLVENKNRNGRGNEELEDG